MTDPLQQPPLVLLNRDAALIEEDYTKKVAFELDKLAAAFENIVKAASVGNKQVMDAEHDLYLTTTQTATFVSGIERLLLTTSNLKAAALLNDFGARNAALAPEARRLRARIAAAAEQIEAAAPASSLDSGTVHELVALARELSSHH